MIAIVDYGVGNIGNVKNAWQALGYQCYLSDKPSELAQAKLIVLPGVGAFQPAMEALQKRGLDSWLQEWAKAGNPLLGICLGMQLLFSESEEDGIYSGLNLIPGRVVRFRNVPLIPHMGWNNLIPYQTQDPFWQQMKTGGDVYFVHSFYTKIASKYVMATANYGGEFSAIVRNANVWGMQFHPEKSGRYGQRLLQAVGGMWQ